MHAALMHILYSLKFLRVKIFEDFADFCLALKFLILKFLVSQGRFLIFFLLVKTWYVCVANILNYRLYMSGGYIIYA